MREQPNIHEERWSEEDERLLKHLLERAGHSRPLPADFGDVRAAVLSKWREKVRRPQWRRSWLGVAAAASLLLVVGWILIARRSDVLPTPGTIAALEGSWGEPSGDGSRFPTATVPGTEVSTGSRRAAYRLGSGHSVRLDTTSRLTFEAPTRLRLTKGAVYVDSFDSSRSAQITAALEVETPLGTVREMGTQFEVRLSANVLSIRVREGRISLNRNGETHVASAREQLRVGGGGGVELDGFPAHGADWEWVMETAPPMAVEGESTLAFLHWVTREGGWELRFASPDLPEASAEITLHGSIAGLNPREALDVALAGSGLSYRIEGAELVVVPSPGD